jgi:cytochrome P450
MCSPRQQYHYDRFVPEQTQVFVHMYSLQRDPRYFSPDPDSFWPDRWLSADQRSSSQEVVHNPVAYIPFSFGPAGCVGKPLALMELRAIACFILQKYQIKPAPGDTEAKMVDGWEDTLQDLYTTQWGALPVVLTRRF